MIDNDTVLAETELKISRLRFSLENLSVGIIPDIREIIVQSLMNEISGLEILVGDYKAKK